MERSLGGTDEREDRSLRMRYRRIDRKKETIAIVHDSRGAAIRGRGPGHLRPKSPIWSKE